MQRIFQAVGDENRRLILSLLRERSMTAGEVAERMPIGKAALSHHFAVLKVAGLVRCEKRGQQRVYSLEASVLEELAAWAAGLAQGVVLPTVGSPTKTRSS